jgi:hypothetical protein
MTISSALTLNWAIILGAVTLLCWMAAGFTAVLGTKSEIRRGDAGRAAKYATTGFAVTGLTALIAMSAVLGLAQ